jgi:monomeric isocitrate dehydrogenase
MPRSLKAPRQLAQAAAEHHTTLNTFASVVALMEGGTIYDAAANATAQKIIKLCQQEQQRQLTKMDEVFACISLGTGEAP